MRCLYPALVAISSHARVKLEVLQLEDGERAVPNPRPSVVPALPMASCSGLYTLVPVAAPKRVQKYPPKPKPADQPAGEAEDGQHSADEHEAKDEEVAGEFDGGDRELALAAFLDDGEQAQLLEPIPEPAGGDLAPGPLPAASSGDPFPLPHGMPPPAPPPVDAAGGAEDQDVTVVFPWGKITYWGKKGMFECMCRNADHGKCVLTRTHDAKGNDAHGMPYGGRPLGFLAAWLLKAHMPPDKNTHWSKDYMLPTLAERQAARESLRALKDGLALLSKERERDTDKGEPEEPVTLVGYVTKAFLREG